MSQVPRVEKQTGLGLKPQTGIMGTIALHNPPLCPVKCHALAHFEGRPPSAATKLPHLFASRIIHSRKRYLNINPLQRDRMNDLQGDLPPAAKLPRRFWQFPPFIRGATRQVEKLEIRRWHVDTGRRIYAMRGQIFESGEDRWTKHGLSAPPSKVPRRGTGIGGPGLRPPPRLRIVTRRERPVWRSASVLLTFQR
jgi:hypothetical protein